MDGDEVEYPLRHVSSSQNITTNKSHPTMKSNGTPRDKGRNTMCYSKITHVTETQHNEP